MRTEIKIKKQAWRAAVLGLAVTIQFAAPREVRAAVVVRPNIIVILAADLGCKLAARSVVHLPLIRVSSVAQPSGSGLTSV